MRKIRKGNAPWMCLVTLLLFTAATVQVGGVPYDSTPAQSIWVDPKSTTGLNVGDTFVVDILINVADPPGAGTGMFGFQYKLKWDKTLVNAIEIDTHADDEPEGDLLPGWTRVFVASNETAPGSHNYSVSALLPSTSFTGVESLCTYTFLVVGIGSCALDIYDDILVDDTATPIDPHDTIDGEVSTFGSPSEPPTSFPVEKIALVIVVAIFFVAALYYVKKRVL